MTVRLIASALIWVGLVALFMSILLSRDGTHNWSRRLAEAFLFTAVFPVVFWIVILPPVIARWFLILLIPGAICLGALLHRR
jgi:hypothetical protein